MIFIFKNSPSNTHSFIFKVDLDKSLILIPEVILRPNEAGELEKKVNISVLNGTAVTFLINTLQMVRNLG